MKRLAGLACLLALTAQAVESTSSGDAFVTLDSLQLERGDLSLTVDPMVGGRIASLRFRGQEVLFSQGHAAASNNWGSTFWLSPQSLWGWPPIATHDSKPYQVLSFEKDSVLLQSAASAEASITKRVSLSQAHEVTLDYEILAAQDFTEVAPWEVTRVPMQGLVFYPITEDSVDVVMGSVQYSVDANDLVWLDLVARPKPVEGKINANGREGWLAWVLERRLYLKVFEPVPRALQAQGEGDVEIYLSGVAPYMELEVQGAAQLLKAGQVLRWQVRWLVTELPAELDVRVGSRALVDFVRSQLPHSHSLALGLNL